MEIKLTDLVRDCLKIAKETIENNHNDSLLYHNWDHTRAVFRYVNEIVENTPEITEEELELLQLAALFHDSYTFESVIDHEGKSANFARQTLESKGFPEIKIQTVERLILATRSDHEPTDILEQIIKDADLGHLKNAKYFKTTFRNLYEEVNTQKKTTPMEWVHECLSFFDSHEFYTDYAKAKFEKGKKKNREKLHKLSDMESNKLDELVKQTEKKKKLKKKLSEPGGRGIETMFRVALRNHVNLSRIADNKANTLISVNAIIISIVLSALFPQLSKNPFLLTPALVLLAFSIITIILSIISTIPRNTQGIITRKDVKEKKGNLIFFGNFHRMSIEDYEWGVDELMKDKDYLYKSLTRDLYYLGRVLHKKYLYLRIGYFTFVAGLVLSIVMFVVNIPK